MKRGCRLNLVPQIFPIFNSDFKSKVPKDLVAVSESFTEYGRNVWLIWLWICIILLVAATITSSLVIKKLYDFYHPCSIHIGCDYLYRILPLESTCVNPNLKKKCVVVFLFRIHVPQILDIWFVFFVLSYSRFSFDYGVVECSSSCALWLPTLEYYPSFLSVENDKTIALKWQTKRTKIG